MNLDMQPIHWRLRRVKSQVQRLERSYGLFAPRLDDYRLSINPNDDFTEHVERIHMDWRIPEWWSTGIGEVMYHLRSTLDNLVWQLVLANGDTPGNQNEFPVAEDECWYQKRADAKLKGVPEAARSIIDQVQPY